MNTITNPRLLDLVTDAEIESAKKSIRSTMDWKPGRHGMGTYTQAFDHIKPVDALVYSYRGDNTGKLPLLSDALHIELDNLLEAAHNYQQLNIATYLMEHQAWQPPQGVTLGALVDYRFKAQQRVESGLHVLRTAYSPPTQAARDAYTRERINAQEALQPPLAANKLPRAPTMQSVRALESTPKPTPAPAHASVKKPRGRTPLKDATTGVLLGSPKGTPLQKAQERLRRINNLLQDLLDKKKELFRKFSTAPKGKRGKPTSILLDRDIAKARERQRKATSDLENLTLNLRVKKQVASGDAVAEATKAAFVTTDVRPYLAAFGDLVCIRVMAKALNQRQHDMRKTILGIGWVVAYPFNVYGRRTKDLVIDKQHCAFMRAPDRAEPIYDECVAVVTAQTKATTEPSPVVSL